jgi:hypothetical protein
MDKLKMHSVNKFDWEICYFAPFTLKLASLKR